MTSFTPLWRHNAVHDVIMHAYFPGVQNDTKRLSISTLKLLRYRQMCRTFQTPLVEFDSKMNTKLTIAQLADYFAYPQHKHGS